MDNTISVCPKAFEGVNRFNNCDYSGYVSSFSTFSIKSATQCDFFSIFFEILFCHYLAKWVSLFSFLSHHYLASSESPQCFASIFGRIFPFPDWLIISKSKIDFSSKTTQQYLFMHFFFQHQDVIKNDWIEINCL